MRYPALHGIRRKRKDTVRFYGLEHTEDLRDGAFYDMENLSADGFPLLTTRAPRKLWRRSVGGTVQPFPADSAVTAAASVNGSLCWCTQTSVYVGGVPVPGLTLSPNVKNRRIIGFGRNIFIAPDGKYIETDTGGAPTVVHAAFSVSGSMRLSYDHAPDTAETFAYLVASDTAPDNVYGGLRWLETAADGLFLHIYDESLAQRILPVYLTVTAANVGASAMVGDTVVVTGLGDTPRTYRIAYVQTGRLWLEGGWVPLTKETYALTLEKRMPVLDHAVEHCNRIWGCRYGETADGTFVNEIYASALGDPAVWDRFDGISTDSYRVSLGCSGDFTGVAVLGSDVLFFKENFIVRVSGTTPADYTVQVIPARGIEADAAATCVNLNERIFYKSFSGVTVYDGALPFTVSRELGGHRFSDAVAAAFNGKYYLAAKIADRERAVYVYDTRTGLWHKEDDDFNVRFFVELRQNLYMLCLPPSGGGYALICADGQFAQTAEDLFGGADPAVCAFATTETLRWSALSGPLGDDGGTRVLRSLVFRLSLGQDAVFQAELFCNGDPRPVRLCRWTPDRSGVFSVPVNTPRCHSYRLRLSGVGACTVYSVAEITEPLSEVNGFGK